jgi:hypothetical protein
MTTMQPAEQTRSRSNVVLAVMLVLGNLFFFGCVVSSTGVSTSSPQVVSQPAKIVLAEG